MNMLASLAWLFLTVLPVLGQVSSPGHHTPLRHIPLHRIHHVPPPLLTFNRTNAEAERNGGPLRFAKAVQVDIGFHVHEVMRINTLGDRVWRAQIHSQDAVSLSLLFDDWWIPDGAEVYVYTDEQTLGAFKSVPSNKPSGQFATMPLAGDTLTLEYFSPWHVKQSPRLHVHKVVHGYRFLPLLFPNQSSRSARFRTQQTSQETRTQPAWVRSGICNVDMACDVAGSAWVKESRSVGVLLTDDNQMYCTGALLNNANLDGRQLFLTAHHCTVSSNPATDIVMFNHDRHFCSRPTDNDPSTDTVQGLSLLARYVLSDYALYEIQEPIPSSYDVYLAGWTTTSEPVPPLVGIHHPSGDVKKLAIYDGELRPTCWNECPIRMHWRVGHWTRGTTEAGSSGSPLFDATHRIVGQLHGGSASCWNKRGYDVYGSLKSSWSDDLNLYLDPEQTGVRHLDGIERNTLVHETNEGRAAVQSA